MKRLLFCIGAVFALIILSACQTSLPTDSSTSLATPTIEQDSKAPIRAMPVDVPSTYISEQELRLQLTPVGNLLANPGFEFGSLDGWTACEAGGIELSTDAYEGSGALEVVEGNCFFQSVGINPDTELTLSCYVKILEGSSWTGMGLGFADNNWTPIGEGVSTVITGSSYQRYDVTATAPANSQYVSMWFYSDNSAVVDNCSLYPQISPPPPPPPSGENLLENPSFGFRDVSTGIPRDWAVGCGGTARVFEIRDPVLDGDRGVSIKDGACLDQSLSASDVTALNGNDFTLSCLVNNLGGYAAMTIFLDGTPITKTIPVSEFYQVVSVQANAGNLNSAFVSLYGEGSQSLLVDECGLRVGSQGVVQKPRIYIGSPFRLGQPRGETVHVRFWNTGNTPLTNIEITSNNITDCNFSKDSLQINEQFRYECTAPSLAPGETYNTILTAKATSPDGETVTRTTSLRIESAVGIGNFLENHIFFSRDANNKPTEWNKGCGGTWTVPEGTNIVQLYGGACMDQAFSAGEIEVLKGKNYKLVCALSQTGGYASMSVFLDGVVNSKVIPLTTDPDGFESITLTGTAGQDITEGFVSFYSEGDATNNLTLSSCSFNIVQ